MKQWIAFWIWHAAEYFGWDLGRFASQVFGAMIGFKGRRIK